MDLDLRFITIRDLFEDYQNNDEEGVFAYYGSLTVRPTYQREFIYDRPKQEAVIDTILQGCPLNIFYWVDRDDRTYEVIDGQQRIMSICEYLDGKYSIKIEDNTKYFHNMAKDIQEKILDYELMVYVCTGKDSEILNWFERINIAGEKHTKQEIRNAVYHGRWVWDARRYFSKTACVAHRLGGRYMKGKAIRQEYLETVIRWKADAEDIDTIEKYMSQYQLEPNAEELWEYFTNVIEWIESIFTEKPTFVKYMVGIDWGILYNDLQYEVLNTRYIQQEVSNLMDNDEVEKKAGIFEYVLRGKRPSDKKLLNLRSFADKIKQKKYKEQRGYCAGEDCNEPNRVFFVNEMEADHIIPWSEGGSSLNENNCQMLCVSCNRRKSNK